MKQQESLLDAIQIYFDALYHCDTRLLNSVFDSKSNLFDADQGAIFVETIDSFSNDVGARVSPASKGQAREDEVLLVDYLSPISAIVKVRLRAHQNVFVDHLSFVKGQDGWQIVAKVWHLQKVL